MSDVGHPDPPSVLPTAGGSYVFEPAAGRRKAQLVPAGGDPLELAIDAPDPVGSGLNGAIDAPSTAAGAASKEDAS